MPVNKGCMGVLSKRSDYGVAISKYVCAMLRCRKLVSLHSIDKQGLLLQLEKDSFICKTAMWQTCDILAYAAHANSDSCHVP